jgi:RimJ/RimL family protein N-acetyltransferase
MPYYPKVRGEKCYLSPLQVEDGDLWAQWLNDLEVSLPLGDEAYSTCAPEQMRQDASEAIRRRDPIFTIVDLETNRPIGRCLLFGIDPVNRSAMLGIFIGDKACWHHGYGAEAMRLLLDYAFNLLNLHSIELGVFAFNQHAIQLYEKVGFKVIGMRREARIIGGVKWGAVLMDMLEDEFRARWPSTFNLPVEASTQA